MEAVREQKSIMLHHLAWWILLAACNQYVGGSLNAQVTGISLKSVFSFIEESHPLSYAEIKHNFFNHYDQEMVFPDEIFPDVSSQWFQSRPKRSVVEESELREFAFKGFGEHFHLELKPEMDLLAPGFKVYHMSNGIPHRVEENVQDLESCLFSGKLRHQPRSSLALNLCGGMKSMEIGDWDITYMTTSTSSKKLLTDRNILHFRIQHGLIKSENAEYLIEPASQNISDERATSRPHVLKRRSIEKTKKGNNVYKRNLQTHFCGKRRRYMPHKPRRKDHWLPDEFPEISPKSAVSSRSKRWTQKDGPKRQHPPRRHKRSVETLVVADREMVRKHGTENVTTYLLTVFNMVSMLYQDSSIDSNVSVILVGLVLLEGDEPGLTLSHNAESSLSSFCQWQSTIHTSSGRQHDHAVLVTGLDICSWKDEPCDTLGYAPISGMCSKYRSCTVNEDSGLALAFTVAHEIGHNFGMLHDGQGSSPCRKGRGTIMSASLSGLDTSVLWSECSRRDLAHFLQSPRSHCLKNEPDSPGELQFPNHLPGQLYDADMQCRLQFGNKSKLCSHYPRKNEVCRSLWCQRNGRECETKFLPAAEGTPCGKNKWCRKGSCIDRDSETLKVVDGGWSEFTEWSNCSRSCDGGLMVRERFCDSPVPQNGGNYCKGEEKEYQICGTKECEPDNPEYLSDQCSTFNKRTVKGKLYKWKPYGKDLGALSRCRIYCVPDKEDLYLVLSTKLQDGTSCSGNFSGVCIDGECRSVGCDGKVDSSVTPDYCGICNGDNSTCQTVRGTFHAINLTAGYHEVVRIPIHSRHLHISESRESPPYLALKDASGQRRLNKNWVLDWPGRYTAAGTVFSYRRWPGKSESLVAKGPTMEELTVEVLVQENEEAVINYKFVVAYKKPEWKYQNSSCSTSCGTGIYTATPVCVDAAGKVINDTNCDMNVKFISLTYPCHEVPCPPRWQIGKWSECNPNACDSTWQHRAVFCTIGQKEVSKTLCVGIPRPDDTRQCPNKECPYMWFTGSWSKCRGMCSNGFQTRSVTCRKVANGTAESFSNCDQDSQPPHMRKCKSDNCSTDNQSREAVWVTGQWSQCNVDCGLGNQTRNVSCIRKSTGILQSSKMCNYSQKPSTSQVCIISNCNETNPQDCTDYYEWCPHSTNDRLCKLKFYATNCCKTCRNIF